jgi:hypothetical protein
MSHAQVGGIILKLPKELKFECWFYRLWRLKDYLKEVTAEGSIQEMIH